MPLHIIRKDITKMKVDAIVNSTNEEMVGYSGVDLAVHEGAGPQLAEACAQAAPLGLGCAKITEGYGLPAKYIIHTSGPIWHGGLSGERILLQSCYEESLKLAVENGCESVAFPLISSGTYGYPKDQVLTFAVQVIAAFLLTHELTVYLCVFDKTSYEFSRQLYAELSELLSPPDDALGAICYSDIPDEGRCGRSGKKRTVPEILAPCAAPTVEKDASLRDYLQSMDKSFGYQLFDWIDARGMTDVECYKKANVDKKTFSKIKCNPQTYKPSKQTAVAFAIALRLNLDETQALLASAGLTLSHSLPFDKIIRYFIQNERYDIFEINEALFEFDQVCLGC